MAACPCSLFTQDKPRADEASANWLSEFRALLFSHQANGGERRYQRTFRMHLGHNDNYCPRPTLTKRKVERARDSRSPLETKNSNHDPRGGRATALCKPGNQPEPGVTAVTRRLPAAAGGLTARPLTRSA